MNQAQTHSGSAPLSWHGGPQGSVFFSEEEVASVVANPRLPAFIVLEPSTGRIGAALGGELVHASAHAAASHSHPALQVIAALPPVFPERLGDPGFLETHGVRFPYIAGEMANGIASARMVIAMARGGMLGFFGAAGLEPVEVTRAIREIRAALPPEAENWGANLIHTPVASEHEEAIVDLYLKEGVRRVCASAYLRLTASVVRYACTGLALDPSGRIRRHNYVFAKVSQPWVASQFMSPPPPQILEKLRQAGRLTREEAHLGAHLPLAEDVTVEADSGGHTDNRPLDAMLPTIMRLRDELTEKYRYSRPIRVGAAGGLGTPTAIAAAFAAGADYVLTGSINQATREAGMSDGVKAMLATVGITDVVMAPAPDMFEMGIKVQVLRRPTMYASRAGKLYELYRKYENLDEIPEADRQVLERDIFKTSMENVWVQTQAFFARVLPQEIERASKDAKHKMALVFRWYLGLSSKWAIHGDPERKLDYQIWCGPAMGAFNAWTRGSFLAEPRNRDVVQVARNLMEGAAHLTRAQQMRSCGIRLPRTAFHFQPRPLR
jgi:trans-AT polyketide synthase, acyltransferase and oxidoreductase domains